MELIKVLIVDDEILAIEDINNLINWGKNGFKIVATTTSSKQAIELFKIH